MNESSSINSSFIDVTREGTLIGKEIERKKRSQLQKESEQLQNKDLPQKKVKTSNFNDIYEGEWFVDAEEDEELMDFMLEKHGFGTTYNPYLEVFGR